MKFIDNINLFKLLDTLKSDYRVYVPVKKGTQRFYKKYDTYTEDMLIGEVRPFEPLKVFFTRARETVAKGFKADVPYMQDKPFAIVGVKNCDLKQGFQVQDSVFEDHDYKDPLYIKNRQDNLIIAADCTCAIPTCFCLAAGNQPYPEANFDINLSQVNGGFIVEIGSEKGSSIVSENSALFQDPQKEQLLDRQEQRVKVAEEVKDNINKNNVPYYKTFNSIIEKNYDSNIWLDESKNCVECGACNTICPTCHCFFLYDQKNKDTMARLRVCDSCMIKDFARVAGGANPRPKLWMRLRNRFEKKFDFFPKVGNFYACTGCGRCISACPAKIDIRKVLRRLAEGA